jgi:hypothetical protein
MTTSAPQWPGQDGASERTEANVSPTGLTSVGEVPERAGSVGSGDDLGAGAGKREAARAGASRASERPALRTVPDGAPRDLRPIQQLGGAFRPVPGRGLQPVPPPIRPQPVPARDGLRPVVPPPGDAGGDGRPSGRRTRFVVVRDAKERELWAARRRARATLPSPVVVTRDIAMALLEVEAGCRSAAQLERVFSPQLWEALEHRIGRRGGPLASGRSLISVRCQEDRPGLADTVAVVWRGDLVRPVALRLDASSGRWTVTELRWWRNETDTAATLGRDGSPS